MNARSAVGSSEMFAVAKVPTRTEPPLAGVQGGELPLGSCQAFEHLYGVPVQGASGRVQAYAVAGRPPSRLLQRRDAPGHRGLVVVERGSGR
ncbi:hypothetical protein [Streptomyces flavidovirens]|uniref:hypothetical protein n=1 Tax=Streptomyces flavidovirens TaxID=67298 RepID=UPI0004054E9C|nr:hypothetical protein [Streptomyces flavidovirens]